jgi:hypothetical protein
MSAASTEFCMPTSVPTDAVAPGHRRSHGQCNESCSQAKPGVEPGDYLPAHKRASGVAVTPPGDRSVDRQGSGLSCRRPHRSGHRSQSGQQGLKPRAVQ